MKTTNQNRNNRTTEQPNDEQSNLTAVRQVEKPLMAVCSSSRYIGMFECSSLCISLLLSANCLLPTANCFSQGIWTQKADFGGTARNFSVSFSIGTRGYIGTGFDGATNIIFQDFWEWDQITNIWTQKADFGGGGRYLAAGFSIGTKGYIGTGYGASNAQDFWEWDGNPASPTYNTWTPKANFGGTARNEAVGFSIGTKGYIGTGSDGGNTQDFWEWDGDPASPVYNTWLKKADFGGVARREAVGFSIGSKGYIGTGYDDVNSTLLKDFWEWDQASNIWTKKADFGGAAREMAVGFSIGCKGYIGTGWAHDSSPIYNDLLEYDPSTDTWTIKANFGGIVRCGAGSFSIGTKGYVGTGGIWSTSSLYNDFWEYTPIYTCLTVNAASTNPLCDGQCTGTATVTAANSIPPYTYNWSNAQTTQTITGLCAGTYSILVTDAASGTATATVTIIPPTAVSLSVTATQSSCNANTGTATANASGGIPSYTYNWNNGQTTPTITGLAAGNYTATVTDANGCTQTQTVSVTQTSGPTATANATPVTITLGDSTQLIATGGGAYFWSPATGLSCTTCANPTATPLWGAGGLIYCVTVTDTNGCTDNACVTITIQELPCGALYVPNAFAPPNAFTPNGDNENERLCVYGNCIEKIEFVIYDRWGEKVFSTTDIGKCWNGTYKGKRLNSAVFVYYLEATLTNGEKFSRKGNISLIR